MKSVLSSSFRHGVHPQGHKEATENLPIERMPFVDKNRQNQTQFTRWVSGGQQPPSRKVEQETVTLIPDKEDYQPGDVAQLLVQSPFSPAEGLLTVSRSGLLYTRRFHIEDGSTTLDVPIDEAHIPNLNLQVDLVGAAPRLDEAGEVVENVPPRPAYASGNLTLNIPPVQRTLSLAVTPEERELEPGGETTVTVVVKDARGTPVADAELAVVVVDEAILALSNYLLANPLEIFYASRLGDSDHEFLDDLVRQISLSPDDVLCFPLEIEQHLWLW